MKQILIIFLLSTLIFSKEVENDIAYELVSKELGRSVPISFVQEAFSHQKLEIHKIIVERFAKPYEKKPWTEYKKIFVKESRVVAGAKFYSENGGLIERVSSKYGVDPFVIVTIAGVESNYGVHHSQYSVFNALYSQIHEIPRRSKWATRELAEFIKYCFKDRLDTQEIGGSYAGAFGYGQFIPSSFISYSVDGNKDGKRRPYDWDDVIASITNYLIKNGYPSSEENKKSIYKSIYAYNHADNYVKAVLALSEEIKKNSN